MQRIAVFTLFIVVDGGVFGDCFCSAVRRRFPARPPLRANQINVRRHTNEQLLQ